MFKTKKIIKKSFGSVFFFCFWILSDEWLMTSLISKGFLRRGFSLFINPTALPRWWTPIRLKQLSEARACVRYWPGRGLVYVCPCVYVCNIFNAIELSSINFLSITVFHDISKQIQQRARIGKIFARWHLAIALTS